MGTAELGGSPATTAWGLADDGSDVASLDPLEADAAFALLPTWNRRSDTRSISLALRAMTPSRERVTGMTLVESLAAIRDLGMMASSLQKLGVNPVEIAPDLEERLLELGRQVDMVPRDTVYHYGLWNPPGARERSFTGEHAEDALIDAARTAAPAIDRSLSELAPLMDKSVGAAEISTQCHRAAEQLGGILCAIGRARAGVPPEFFARVLRPYFAELTLGGTRFSGASAAPLSVCIVDHIVWSSDCCDQRFRTFQAEQIRYNLPHWRRLHANTLDSPSVVSRLLQAGGRDQHTTAALESVHELLRVLVTFRGRHQVVAERAYDASIRTFEVGSGGYGPDTLRHLLVLTRDAAIRIKARIRAESVPIGSHA